MSRSVTCSEPHQKSCYERVSDNKDRKDLRISLETVKASCGSFMRVSGRQPQGSSAHIRDSAVWVILDHLQKYRSINETLYVTPEEFQLWEILQGTLDLSLWKVKVGWQLVQNSAIIYFTGPQKVVSNAKTAFSKLMILLNSTVKMNLSPGLIQEHKRMIGFFQVENDLRLYLWKGEASSFRASVIINLSSRPLEGKTAPKVRVMRQHILNERGFPQVLLQVVLSHSLAGHSLRKKQAFLDETDLMAGAITLALQAASQEKSASLVIHPTGPEALAKGITLGVKEFKSMKPMNSSLKNLTIAVDDNDFVAKSEVECCKWWPYGKDHHVLLPYVMSCWEAVLTQVVDGSLISQKTDVVVLPWILEPHNKIWVQETSPQVQAALENILNAQVLLHGNIITIPALSLPGLHCQILYIICLDAKLVQQQLKVNKQVIQQLVWSCLSNVLGSFLESISFPLLDLETTGNSNPLHIMLEEINNFLKQTPNTWMKLVQIVRPRRAADTQKVTEDFKSPLEAIGLCQKEDHAFIQYLHDHPAVFRELEDNLKEIGCVFQICVSLGVLKFIAEGENLDPSVWEKDVECAFQKNKKRYAVHYETNPDILNVLKKQQLLVKSFENIQEYEGPCFVGPTEAIKMFVQCLQEMAFNEKPICVEHPIIHLPRYTVVKNTISKLLSYSPVSIDLAEDPLGMLTFQGPQQDVLEVKRQFYTLLSDFKDWPVMLSPFQEHFIQSLQEELFNENFFLAQDISAVLKTSDGVMISGLDFGELAQAEELLKSLVCERRIDIEEEVQWAASGLEWDTLLIALRSQKKVIFYNVKSQQDILTSVVIVGTRVEVVEAETNIREYLISYSIVEDQIISSRPELAEARENLLRIMNWGNLKVNIWIQTKHSTLTLKLKGPRRHVKEAREVVQTDLNSLTVRSIPVRYKGVQQYLLGTGATVLFTFAEELQCLVKIQVPKEITNVLFSGASANIEESELTSNNELLKILRRYRKEHLTFGKGDPPPGLVQVLGREMNLAKFQEAFEDFISGYYSETFNNDKIVTLSEECLQDVLYYPYYFPLNLSRHGNLLRIQGFQEDVRKATTAVQALIQEAEDTDKRAEALKSVIQWQYDNGNKGLSPFDKTANLKLEVAYREEKENIEIILDSRRTQVNLKKREGLVPETGRIFKIKRDIYIWEMSIPQQWEPMNNEPVKIVKLSPNLVEYQRVARKFQHSMNKTSILKIERIQNPYLWTSYIYKRNWMEKKNPPGVQNEQVLFHGTLAENCSSIIEIGLKSTCRKNGMYGKGIYFAVDACMSSQYCGRGHKGSKFMFQVRVLTGEYCRGDESKILPPEKPGGGRYDSLVDSEGLPKIFVTFFDDHSYPEYLITFR